MQYTNNAGFINACQTVEFINDADTFGFIVGTTYQVGNTVDNDHLNTAILVVKFIHALNNGLQAFFAGHARQVIGFEVVRHFILFTSSQNVGNVFVQLRFRLFGII